MLIKILIALVLLIDIQLVDCDGKCRGFGVEISAGRSYYVNGTDEYMICIDHDTPQTVSTTSQKAVQLCANLTKNETEIKLGAFAYECEHVKGKFSLKPVACFNSWGIRNDPNSELNWWLEDKDSFIWKCLRNGTNSLKIAPAYCFFFRDEMDTPWVKIGCYQIEKKFDDRNILACERQSAKVVQRSIYRYNQTVIENLHSRGIVECK